jgi:hypothetical protein
MGTGGTRIFPLHSFLARTRTSFTFSTRPWASRPRDRHSISGRCLSSTVSAPAFEAHPASCPEGTEGALSHRAKRPGREADYSTPSLTDLLTHSTDFTVHVLVRDFTSAHVRTHQISTTTDHRKSVKRNDELILWRDILTFCTGLVTIVQMTLMERPCAKVPRHEGV